ncbi:unnamed protein product [Sphagnum jensenii]|uniref:Uncharacterized protein n=1 Tax=Sphagnum jensenii TaxID=128206 RepID=A0ABP0VX98_9BRYO
MQGGGMPINPNGETGLGTVPTTSTHTFSAGVIDHMMWKELESALDDDEIEEEEEDCKVLSELAGETAAQLLAAAHRGHTTKNMFLLKPSFSPTV